MGKDAGSSAPGAVSYVPHPERWCAEHPQKTYLQDFLEKFPNAQVYNSGEPLADACDVYGDVFDCKGHKCCDCWNIVMPDEADKEEA